jgi:hypothetical protein
VIPLDGVDDGMNRYVTIVALGLALGGCSKVCEPKPLSGEWARHADLVPPEAQSCGNQGGRLELGFEGKSGPHSFLLMTQHIEKLGGWKEVRYGGSSMDSIYSKDGWTLKFEVRDPKKPLLNVSLEQ